MFRTEKTRPLDAALRDRLHLKPDATVSLYLIRAALQAADVVGRGIQRQPFFAVKESEALLEQMAGRSGQELVRWVLNAQGGTRITPRGIEHVPENDPVIIASTHPTGIFDYLAHAGALLDRRPGLKVVANLEATRFLSTEMMIPICASCCNLSSSAANAHRVMQQHLHDGGALLIFGSGRVSDQQNGCLVERKWQRGATRLSEICNAPIVPAALDARNSGQYYRTRKLARVISGGDEECGAKMGSLHHLSECLNKLGHGFDIHYGAPLQAGTGPDSIKAIAEGLVPGLYAPTHA